MFGRGELSLFIFYFRCQRVGLVSFIDFQERDFRDILGVSLKQIEEISLGERSFDIYDINIKFRNFKIFELEVIVYLCIDIYNNRNEVLFWRYVLYDLIIFRYIFSFFIDLIIC